MKINIKSVSKKYRTNKTKSLDNISMTITKGIFGLLGENGAGKTTLLKTLATIVPVQEGVIMIDNYDISDNTEEVRKLIGYLPQKFNFFENLTVKEMLDYIASLKGVEADDRTFEIESIVNKFNLMDKINNKIKSLSGGMKQRVAIAQSLLGKSELVILDEPTVGLDPNERLNFRNIINEKSQNSTIIISTHIISDIATLCDNVGIIKKGKVVYCGSIDNLLERVDNKIYIHKIQKNETIDEAKYGKIISVLRKKKIIEVRFISDKLINTNYEKVAPTLEDAYFYIMSLEEGNYI